jgi:hypothetical protein
MSPLGLLDRYRFGYKAYVPYVVCDFDLSDHVFFPGYDTSRFRRNDGKNEQKYVAELQKMTSLIRKNISRTMKAIPVTGRGGL